MWFDTFLTSIEHVGAWGYGIGFIAALLESLAFFGLLFPGSLVVVFLGFVASKGSLDLILLMVCCTLGAIVGDALSFSLGRNGTSIFSDANRIFKIRYLDRGKNFFTKHGSYSVFLARFISGMRAVVPYVAGMFRMNVREFFLWNVASAILWSVAHVYVGYLFGTSWRVVESLSVKAGLFVLIAVVVCIIIWYLMRIFIRRGKQFLRFMKSISFTIWDAIVSHKQVVQWTNNHPRIVEFIRQRTSVTSFWGLTLSLLVIAFFYALLAFFGVVQDIATATVFAAVDVRIENLLYAFRSAPVTTFFLWVTMLGSWQVSLAVVLGSSVVLYAWKRGQYIIPLWVAVMGSELLGVISKREFHRPRPVGVAVYAEQSFSFPSGHAIVAIALYGFLTYIAVRYVRRWRYKVYILFAGVSLILLIGVSRLYVGVHYLSDVWGGYLLGFLWLVIGMSLAEWLGRFRREMFFPHEWESQAFRYASTSMAILGILGVYIFIGKSSIAAIPPSAAQFQSPNLFTDQALDIFADGAPQYAETIIGNRQEPMSLIITAPSEESFRKAFTAAGWNSAEQLSFRSMVRLASAATTSGAYPTAPMTPSFWNQEVNDFGFQKPTLLNSIKERHHARFWRTPYVTDEGERVYVGTASLDTHIKWFVTHAISPDIDQERENLTHDLLQGGNVERFNTVQLVSPEVGENIFGDSFFTDGKAYVIDLK